MSDREFARAAVLQRVIKGEVSLAAATPLLAVSYRQARRLLQRFRVAGRKGLVHRSTGRGSNRAMPTAYRDSVLALVKAHYGGDAGRGPGQRFGPTLTAEHLWTDHGLLVSVGTLTRWMREEELWGRVRKARPRHQRRERKAHFGELVQLDGSFHDWFEGRGPGPCVMTMVDDATGRTLLSFGAEETTWAAAAVLQRWIAAYGVPRALYADWKNVYQRAATNNELARGEAPVTQFGRMCTKLGITLIPAASPQAKGRVERGHGTHQDRLIKKLRLRGISEIAAANAYVETEYLPAHNARFAISPASAVDYHRPRDRKRWADADVFCLESIRVVGNDHVVQYQHQALQLDRRARGRVPAKSKVLIRETAEGTVRVVHVAVDGREHALSWTPAVPRAERTTPAACPPMPSPRAPDPETADDPGDPRASPHTSEHPWRQQQRCWVEQARAARARRETATARAMLLAREAQRARSS
ncbi:MAG: ISNCY family transposase [Gemmatimonadaceae bacterium]|nr:ISNCY family transposase [Gemmatimonadaceae bacterium]